MPVGHQVLHGKCVIPRTEAGEVAAMSPAEQDNFLNQERKRWAAVVAAAGIKLD